MIGRAGRPGFDTTAVAVVMVVEDKKNFYKRVRPMKRDVFGVRIVLSPLLLT
jgi:replicative superfamily II helicase